MSDRKSISTEMEGDYGRECHSYGETSKEHRRETQRERRSKREKEGEREIERER